MSPLVQRQTEPLTHPSIKQQPSKQKVFKGGITKGEKVIFSAAIIAVVMVLFMVISNYASIYITNHQIQQTERGIQQQVNANEALNLQVMELSDPERILSEAKEMGMVLDPNNVRYTHSNNH
ncbi:cell division protein FtsL [Evansella cellulosilytica]|uniref:Cell division protein FtsL n=1 Tax=Evansella cellulosilytica (strain ATCC 21833 / DSM 2522 / FERM P-1141 / JCM 9156 / N-4) TaxID=649639 RepID=E6TTT7_EVAC2|nr:cell division protein FtsL [Evansella cellulosilytica]ADU30856.1 cell division protein FtsL [Evansella cellulosilytica DSM 2522]